MQHGRCYFFTAGLKASVTHHGREAADEFDAVLHLLVRDLHRRAVLLLQGERVRAALRHPGVELQAQGMLYVNRQTFATPSSGSILSVTFISCTVILVSGFLSSILSTSSFKASLIAGLVRKASLQVVGKDKKNVSICLTNKRKGFSTPFGQSNCILGGQLVGVL